MRQRAGVQSRSKAVREIQAGLKRLSRGFRLLTREVLEEAARPGNGRGRRISPGRRIHGRYIGLIRNLPVRQKAKVRADLIAFQRAERTLQSWKMPAHDFEALRKDYVTQG